MRKVETKIQPLSFYDASGNERTPDYDVKITDSTLFPHERVVLNIAGCKYELLAKDLIAAIENATNF